jgi:hypothetical protein
MTYSACLAETTADKLDGFQPLHTRAELDKVIANTKESNRIIIRGDFAEAYFTPTSLSAFIKSALRINRNIIIDADGANVLTMDSFIGKLMERRSNEELIDLAVKWPKEFYDAIQYLAKGDFEKRNELLAASRQIANLQSINDQLLEEKDDLQEQLNMEQRNKYAIQAAFQSLVKRINYQYGAGIDERHLFHVDTNSYDKIVYIKEISRVQYLDSFVFYLKEILKVLHTMPTRLTVVESFYATKAPELYPYLKPHFQLREKDVMSGDILMLGIQPQLMTDILKNASNISVLIVLDRAGMKESHIIGNNVEYFYAVSDVSDAPTNVPKTRIISYNPDTLFIPMIDGFAGLDSSEKLTRYSSLRITTQFVNLLEKGSVKIDEQEE